MASGQTLCVFKPQDNEPPASNYATLDTRNGHLVLEFDTTTQEVAIFKAILPRNYSGGGITATVTACLDTATSGTLGWDIAFERIGAAQQDIDSDGFATAKTITATTVPGTSGNTLVTSVAFSNSEIDGLLAGEAFRIRLRRDPANDNAAGDAQFLLLELKET